jgi:hypothetical protein
MTTKTKTQAGCDPDRGCNCENLCDACHCSEPSQQTQPPRVPTALLYGLKVYAAALQPYAETTGDKVAASMIDCCNHLLLEANRLGGRNDY